MTQPDTNSLEDMQGPVTCYRCNEWVELDDCAFFTPACNCSFMERCGHGICKTCEATVEGQTESEAV